LLPSEFAEQVESLSTPAGGAAKLTLAAGIGVGACDRRVCTPTQVAFSFNTSNRFASNETEETNAMASSNPCIEKQFYNARTHSAWIDKPVTDETLRELYDASKWGPNQRKCFPSPLRIHSLGEGEGKTPALAIARKRGEDHEGTRYRHRRLRPPIL
jgi:hypothetical protein